ncbi:MAG TPA: pyroglutamyl-peptidase I [Candidatus Caccousia avistercoris]|nr:pyroglutamyl-peptidase I [Candidatus Caccousia avistercoris]
MKVLITGFEPFGGETVNPSWEAVKLLPRQVAGAELVRLRLPTAARASLEALHRAMREEAPDIVMAVGQAGGRFGVTPERVALNLDDFSIPDNAGDQPIDTPIFADGAPAYFSNLPVKAMVQAIREAGYPASLSHSAGTYVCNHVMYGILYYMDKEFPSMRGGFLHVPFSTAQAAGRQNAPSMSLPDIASALEAAVKAAVLCQTDLRQAGGSIH